MHKWTYSSKLSTRLNLAPWTLHVRYSSWSLLRRRPRLLKLWGILDLRQFGKLQVCMLCWRTPRAFILFSLRTKSLILQHSRMWVLNMHLWCWRLRKCLGLECQSLQLLPWIGLLRLLILNRKPVLPAWSSWLHSVRLLNQWVPTRPSLYWIYLQLCLK